MNVESYVLFNPVPTRCYILYYIQSDFHPNLYGFYFVIILSATLPATRETGLTLLRPGIARLSCFIKYVLCTSFGHSYDSIDGHNCMYNSSEYVLNYSRETSNVCSSILKI